MRDTFFRDRQRLLSGMVAVTCVIYFAAIFSFVKDTIPYLNPFSWDPTFAEWDRILHGGVDPYILLAPIFGNPLMTKLADSAYSFWLLLVHFFSFVACMDIGNPHRRNTFLFAFVLIWIISGSVLAILLSSVGPVYYQAFGFGDQFMPLMNMLKDINDVQPLTALELQTMLLDGYQSGNGMKGISAMPSMHVAMSWIIAFHAFQFHKTFGWLMVGFAVLIQLSSVHLGWHYAIDGYLGFAAAIICWLLAKQLANLQQRFEKRLAA
ncbi:phosphatase PAP2 family protein [uncultured Roseovarius sp.]|uniref:phosphatase PAP2 family protein n=1 Tax=uncultured Roseovarius sp. TaxID=293344 RepID=UPI002636B19D|nr:phosphatase PAP2 family protein [uncultured Roseovarius sp.]